MSLQPCLPLPPSCSSRPNRKRRRGRKRPREREGEGESGGGAGRNDDEDSDSGDATSAGTRRNMPPPRPPPPHEISDLTNMSALEFLGRVHEESRRLGDVFVADGQGGRMTCNAATGAPGLLVHVGGVDRANDATDEEEEEGEISETTDGPGNQPPPKPSDSKRKSSSSSPSKSRTNKPRCSNVGISGSLAYLLSDRTDLPRPPSAAHLPTAAAAADVDASLWINATIHDFSQLRLYLDACAEGGVGGKRSGTRVAVPPLRARDGWHAFCLGREEAQGYYQDDDDDDDADGRPREPEPWEANLPPAGHPPGTALLCQMDQVMVRRVLAHHASYLCGSSTEDDHRQRHCHAHAHPYAMTTNRARWVYGLLARLAKPLHRDDAAVLRQLLRECCARRARLDMTRSSATTRAGKEVALLNALIAIAGIYFEQGTADALFTRL